MTRAAIYARYSSDLQSDNSIEDQIRICREFAQRQGWEVVQVYKDRAISAASLIRPGIQSLLEDARAGDFDIILAEALDRISRDQADIAAVFRDMNFSEIRIHTLSEGAIDHMHIGLKGTMNALFLKDLRLKVQRGLRGRVENGKSAGGIGYGYEVVRQLDAAGNPLKGDRRIKEDEAAIIRRIFEEYGRGDSPRAIAKRLNAQGIPAPRGVGWSPSTINGNPGRGTGILNNELYRGRLVWNRQKFIKNPQTGKRVTRFNPESEWIAHDLPELRIVSDEAWEMVKIRQREVSKASADKPKANRPERARRPKYLLSGLVKCGECGGTYTQKNHYQLGCATYYTRGTCSNTMRLKREELEKTVLDMLRNRLMHPEIFEEFCAEYTRRLNQIQHERTRSRALKEAEIEKINRHLKKLVTAIMDGVPALSIKDEMLGLEARRAELEAGLKDAPKPVPLLHPSLALRYRQELDRLHVALEGDDNAEAFESIRNLIDRIVVKPEGESFSVELEGALPSILNLASGGALSAAPLNEITMVAEEGLEPPTRGL